MHTEKQRIGSIRCSKEDIGCIDLMMVWCASWKLKTPAHRENYKMEVRYDDSLCRKA